MLLQLWIFAPAHIERNLAALAEARRSAAGDWMPTAAFAAQCAACIGHDSLERLSGLRCPTLLTVGERDIFTPPHLTAAMIERLPAARIATFAGCGHAHHWEDLERFNELGARFLLGEDRP